LLTEAWEKAVDIKKTKDEEKNKTATAESEKAKRPKSKTDLSNKPRWNERKTSWKAADFDSVQALID
jgi:hypothetical protein